MMEDAPIEAEQLLEKNAAAQGEHTTSVPVVDQFWEGIVESASKDANDDDVEPVERGNKKGKEVAPEIPLLTRKPHRRLKKKHLKINLNPITDSQSQSANSVSALTSELQNLKREMEGLKQTFLDLSVSVREYLLSHAPPSSSGPSGPFGDDEFRPSRPGNVEQNCVEERPSAPVSKDASGPTGQLDSVDTRAEEPDVDPEPPVSSTLPTLAPPSRPTSSTAPPAPTTFKRPRSRPISSPTPFPSHSTSSPTSSTIIRPPSSSVEDPPASSSAGASSSGPSSTGPSDLPSISPQTFFHPQTPPSFTSIIPEGAQIVLTKIQDIKDELEVAILRSVLTPKYLGCLNTLHPNPRDEFTTFWGRVEELLVARELWINHKKDIFFPRSPAATCTNHPLKVDQMSLTVQLYTTLDKVEAGGYQESDDNGRSSDSENDEMAMLTRQFKKFLKFKTKGSGNFKPFQKKDSSSKFDFNRKSDMIVCYECKKLGHMRGECPELKKKLKKDKFTFKKAKAMLATWSDEDGDEDTQVTFGDEEIHCLMARSEDSTESKNKALKKKINSLVHNKSNDEQIAILNKEIEMMKIDEEAHSEEMDCMKAKLSPPLHRDPPLSNITFLMDSKGKRAVPRQRPISPKVGEGSRATAECRTKHRDDHLPELTVPPNPNISRVWGTFTKFVQPRYVDFESLEDMFPGLQPLFDTQGWTVFLYSHTRHSPTVVTEFYNNLEMSVVDEALYTTVNVHRMDGRVTRTLTGQVPDVEEVSAKDDDDDEDSQAEPMDAQGDDREDAEDRAPLAPAQSLQDFITGQMAQLQNQITTGFEHHNNHLDHVDTRMVALADTH
ncbi:hypothetical protein Taro_042903, partial [Colocasia esculenta]|nr:hypothetical protein [Colocasia esculenta]